MLVFFLLHVALGSTALLFFLQKRMPGCAAWGQASLTSTVWNLKNTFLNFKRSNFLSTFFQSWFSFDFVLQSGHSSHFRRYAVGVSRHFFSYVLNASFPYTNHLELIWFLQLEALVQDKTFCILIEWKRICTRRNSLAFFRDRCCHLGLLLCLNDAFCRKLSK